MVEEFAEGDSGSYLGRFVRIRVQIDITQPLKQYVWVGINNGEEVIILLTYERLPDFCYLCIIISHSLRYCGVSKEPNHVEEFGIWLRAHVYGNRGKAKPQPPKNNPRTDSTTMMIRGINKGGGKMEKRPTSRHVSAPVTSLEAEVGTQRLNNNEGWGIQMGTFIHAANMDIDSTNIEAAAILLKPIPWLVGGDLNEICFDNEKIDGNRWPASQTSDFRNVIDICNLQSLHFDGEIFTLVNLRHNYGVIFERLDRYVGSFP